MDGMCPQTMGGRTLGDAGESDGGRSSDKTTRHPAPRKDLNSHNKLIFGSHKLQLAQEMDIVPEEIYSTKGRMTEDTILQQVLVYDLAW